MFPSACYSSFATNIWPQLTMQHQSHHSMASSRPVPFVAEVLKICHFLSLRAGRPRELATSAGVIACSMSCLFANTTRMAFFSSSSCYVIQGRVSGHGTHITLCTGRHDMMTINYTVSGIFHLPLTWLPVPTWRCPSCLGHCCLPHRWWRLCWNSNTSSMVWKRGMKGWKVNNRMRDYVHRAQ